MVVGNGMLAKAFEKYKDDDSVVIFASGVSNSKETDFKQFDREWRLMNNYKGLQNSKFIYFSTTSVFDLGLQNSEYIKHKRALECFIESNFNNYIIFRLPQIIGKTDNNNTFYNHFKNKIINLEKTIIHENANRWIIDIGDVSNILSKIIDSPDHNRKIMNVAFDNKTSVLKLVNLMEILLRKKTEKEIVPAGSDYDFDNREFVDFVNKNGLNATKGYNVITLKKYL